MKFDIPITGTQEDDRAVSPVVGVALLIAITVILAAVIGFVVLDTTVASTDAPNARLTFDVIEEDGEPEDVVVSHEGGNQFDSDTIVFKVLDDEGEVSDEYTYAEAVDGEDDTFNTGDAVEVEVSEDYTVIVFWDDPQSDRELQLGKATMNSR